MSSFRKKPYNNLFPQIALRLLSLKLYMLNPKAAFFLLILTPFLFPGCAVYSVQESSVPVVDQQSGITGDEDPDKCTIQLDEINISIKPVNSTGVFASAGIVLPIIPIAFSSASDERDEDPFIIFLRLFPKSSAISFEPMKMSLTIGATNYSPIGYKQLVARNHPRPNGDCDVGCDYNEHPFIELDTVIPISSNSCFEIQFPIETYKTKREFILKINGFTADQRELLIPDIQFRNKKIRQGRLLGGVY